MVRRAIYLCAAVILVVALAVWQLVFYGVHPRLIFAPPPPDAPRPAVLDEFVSLDVKAEPLRKLLNRLADQYDFPIDIENAALTSIGVKGTEPISCRLSNVRLKSLLNLVVRGVDHRLVAHVRDGTLVVTTSANWRLMLSNYNSKVYRLELLASALGKVNEREISEIIQAVVSPGGWRKQGGGGDIVPVPGALVVSQTPDIHEQIESLLAKLAESGESGSLRPIEVDDSHGVRASLHLALDKITSVHFRDTPLADVCRQLFQQHDIPIWLDVKAIDDDRWDVNSASMDGGTPVNIDLEDVPLRTALELILRNFGLWCCVQDDVVLVSTRVTRSVRLYAVSDILEPPAVTGEDLLKVVSTQMVKYGWGSGANGHLIRAAKLLGATLVVSGVGPEHQRIERLLAEYRHARFPALAGDPTQTLSERNRVEEVLRQPVSIHVDRTDVMELLFKLARQHKFNIWVSPENLSVTPRRRARRPMPDPFGGADPFGDRADSSSGGDPFGIPSNQADEKSDDSTDATADPFRDVESPKDDTDSESKEPSQNSESDSQQDNQPSTTYETDDDWHVTLHADNMPLEAALRWILRMWNFSFPYRIRDNVLLVNSSNTDQSETKCYAVSAYLGTSDGPKQMDEIAQVLDQVVDPSFGQSIDRLGEILVITRTREYHQRFERVLSQLAWLREHADHTKPLAVEQIAGPYHASIRDALRQPVSFEFIDVRLDKVIGQFADKCEFPIFFDKLKLDWRLEQTRVTAVIDQMPLGDALERILDQSGLVYSIRDAVVWISQAPSFEWNVQLYGVADLAEREADDPETRLASVLQNHGKSDVVEHLPGVLLVNDSQHRENEQMLAALRKVLANKKPGSVISLSAPLPDVVERFKSPLKVKLKYGRARLSEVLRHVSRQYGISIISCRELAKPNEPCKDPVVSFEADDEPLAQVFDRLLKKHGVRYEYDPVSECLTGQPIPPGSTRIIDVSDLVSVINKSNPTDSLPFVIEHSTPAWPPNRTRLDDVLRTIIPRPGIYHGTGYRSFTVFDHALIVSEAVSNEPPGEIDPDSDVDDPVDGLLSDLRSKFFPDIDERREVDPDNDDPFGESIRVYDVQPVLTKLAEMSPHRLVELVQTTISPQSLGEWRGRGIMSHVNRVGPGDAEHLAGLLVVRHSEKNHAQIEKLLRFLQSDGDRFPQPGELRPYDNPEARRRLVSLVGSSKDSIARRYAIWLITLLPKQTDETVQALVQRLAKTNPVSDLDEFVMLVRALRSCGPQAAKAVPILVSYLQNESPSGVRFEMIWQHLESEMIKAISVLGDDGVKALCQTMKDSDKTRLMNIAAELEDLGQAAQLATETILELSDQFDDDRLKSIISKIDTQFKTTSAILARWEKSNSAERRNQAKRLRIVLHELLPAT